MLRPAVVSADPQTTSVAHAFACGLITPPVSWWLPQLIVRLQGLALG
jgi:hypothetical protein